MNKLPSVSEIKKTIVPSKLSEIEWDNEFKKHKEKTGGLVSDGAIAMMIGSTHGYTPALKPKPKTGGVKVKDIMCVQKLDPMDYFNAEITLFNQIQMKTKTGKNIGSVYYIYTGIDNDYCTFPVYDFECKINEIGHSDFSRYKVEKAVARQQDTLMGVSITPFTKVTMLKKPFEQPDIKSFKFLKHNEFVKVQGIGLFGSFSETESGTVRVTLLDNEYFVKLIIYGNIMDKLIKHDHLKCEYDQLDKYKLEVIGVYKEKERRKNANYTEENFIRVFDMSVIERVWDDNTIPNKQSSQKPRVEVTSESLVAPVITVESGGGNKIENTKSNPEQMKEEMVKTFEALWHLGKEMDSVKPSELSKKLDFPLKKVEDYLEIMKQQGDVYEPKPGQFRAV